MTTPKYKTVKMNPSVVSDFIFELTRIQLVCKKNRYKVGRQGKIYSHSDVKDFIEDGVTILRPQMRAYGPGHFPIERPVELVIVFRYSTNKDNDNVENTIFDLLQTAGIIKNDSQVRVNKTFKVPSGDELEDVFISIRIL